MSAAMTRGSSAESTAWFALATQAILKNWTALQLIVAHQSAGPTTPAKAEWLAAAIPQWFQENPDLTPDEVAGFLEDLIVDEFHVQIEDGSYEEVGGMLLKYQRICHTLSPDQVQTELQKLPRCDLSRSRVQDLGQDPTESEPTMGSASPSASRSMASLSIAEDDGPAAPTPVDPNAWITVAPKKKGRGGKTATVLSE